MSCRNRLLPTVSIALGLAFLALSVVEAATQDAKKTESKFDSTAVAQFIDREVQQKLVTEKIKPSAVADDAEFLRRVYLDITGVVPPTDKARTFLDSKEPNKRAKLIDELLGSANYGKHQADTWQGLLLPKSSDNRRMSTEPLTEWLEKEFNQNTPWNKLVNDLLTSTGTQDKNGAVTFFIANPTADKMTDEVCKLFLGVQLQCAQCHNHPFTGWKQTEYWAMAAFFTKVSMNGNVKNAAKKGITLEISESGGRGKGKQKLPESAKIVPAKFLQGEQPKISDGSPARPVLTQWLTSGQNPFFAKAMVNRTWAQFFGRGLVNPIDDMHDGNPASHPALLQKLADEFVADNFDVKNLIGPSAIARPISGPANRPMAIRAIRPSTATNRSSR